MGQLVEELVLRVGRVAGRVIVGAHPAAQVQGRILGSLGDLQRPFPAFQPDFLGPDGGADFHRIGKDAFGQVQEDFIHFHQRPLDGKSFAGRKVQELAQVQQGKPEVVLRLHQGDAGLGAGGLLLRHFGLCGLAAGGHRLQAGDLRVVQFDLLAGNVYDFVIVKYLYISPCDGYADVVPGAFQIGGRRFQVQP